MFYLAGIAIAFFLSILLFTKRGRALPDYLLGLWLAITGLHLFAFYLVYTERHLAHPTLTAIGFPLPLVQGPFLYLYTLHQTSPRPFRWTSLLHFLPVLLSYLLFSPFFFLSFEEQVEVFKNEGRPYQTHSLINLAGLYLSGIVYVALTLRRLIRHRRDILHRYSNTDKINFNWLLYLTLWLGVIWAVIIFIQRDEAIFGTAVVFILWVGYYGIRQVNVLGQAMRPAHLPGTTATAESLLPLEPAAPAEVEPASLPKYQKSALTPQEAQDIHARLTLHLAGQKPYLNPELSLGDLAAALGIHPNLLSQVINTQEGKTFYDLINAHRVEEFIRRAQQPESRQFTLLAIAFDCGFNSKASFNRNFKRHTGQTPSEHLKRD